MWCCHVTEFDNPALDWVSNCKYSLFPITDEAREGGEKQFLILPRKIIFPVLDAKDGYWQVLVDKEGNYFTTLWIPEGSYRWLRKPFGIKPVAQYECRQRDELAALTGISVISDDILAYRCRDTIQTAIADHVHNFICLLERAKKVNGNYNQIIKIKCGHALNILPFRALKGLQPSPQKGRKVKQIS